MTNRGIAPPDGDTAVGELRYLIGDTDYTAIAPPVAGFGDYANFSDAELEGFLRAGGGSVTRASGYAYLRFAALAAANAISWRSDDLSVDSKIPASEFRLLARIAFEQADAEDEAASGGFALDFPFTEHGDRWGWPAELAPTSNPWTSTSDDT